jgi:acetyl esterase/lipase
MRQVLLFCLFAFSALIETATAQAPKNNNNPQEEKEKKAGKGSKMYEAVRLPMHIFRLATSRVKTSRVDKVSYGSDKRQHFLVCESENVPAYQKEVIFFIHGGGWHIGKPKQHLLLAEMFANAGYLVILPGYRLTPEVTGEEMQDDLSLALKSSMEWITAEKGWTDYKVVVGGASAGGNLGAVLVFDDEALAKHNISHKVFAGFFSLSGALDISMMQQTKILEKYAGVREGQNFCDANPLYHLDGNVLVPVLCIHGDKDGLVHYKTAQAFAERLCQMQCDLVEFHTVSGGTHLATASQWYYKKKKDEGQGAVLLRWLHRLNKKM